MEKNQYIQPRVAAMVMPAGTLMGFNNSPGADMNPGNSAPTRVAPPVPGADLPTKRVL